MSPEIAPDPELLGFMRAQVATFTKEIDSQPGSHVLPGALKPPHGGDLTWHNHMVMSSTFRRAHIEWFEIQGVFAVVHVVILPYLNSNSPIFGFDMMGGRQQATGMFLDFSPVTADPSNLSLSAIVTKPMRDNFSHMRALPGWGSIFSPDVLAIRPVDDREAQQGLALARDAMIYYLRHLDMLPSQGASPDPSIVRGHSAYSEAQRLNPHTFRMLARHVGAGPARKFIDEVLFPLPI